MATGSFVWYELLTKDPRAATTFYKEVIGWSAQEFPGAKEPYTMWVGSQGPLGGLMELPAEAAKMGAPPHWMGYVSVDDVDRATAKVKSLGGRAYVEPTDIPTVGRFSVIADPQGGSLALFKAAQPMAGHDTARAGEFSWHELITTDVDAALGFYGELFGWSRTRSVDLGAMGVYQMYGKDGQTFGGMLRKPPQIPVTTWLYYVHVTDLDRTVDAARARGATLLMGPAPAGDGGDRIAQLLDPQGAAFALHASKT